MRLQDFQFDQEQCLRLAGDALGEPAHPVVMDDHVELLLRKRLRRDFRRGLFGAPPVVRFVNERRGHALEIGVEVYRCATGSGLIRLARIVAPHETYNADSCYEFWAVPVKQYRAFYRFVRGLLRCQQQTSPPLLREGELERLWENAIGFLRYGRELLDRYGVPQKRGVLLLGEPGNGKTMACRWLRAQCNRHRLEWATITAEQFERARSDGDAHLLFQLQRPGILLFDDIDLGARQTSEVGHSGTQSTFLCGLDGLEVCGGVVNLFTSNARLEDLDPAFRRPGRIDVVMHFPRPDATLRRRFVMEHWHAEIAQAIDVGRVVTDTDGLSFAELDELKKLLVFGFLDTGKWDWVRAWGSYQECRARVTPRQAIGFNREHARKGSRASASPCF